MRIAIQGALGSFHNIAAEHYYGAGHEFMCCESFAEVFKALQAGTADAGIVAIENSLYGSIAEVYDLLLKYSFPIVGEVAEHIHQNLIAFPGTDLSQITKVYSHPVAIAQCSAFLESALPYAEIIEFHDTAAAVERVKSSGDLHAAAIAGELAAAMHDMSILQPSIQDEHYNFTRFLAINSTPVEHIDTNKASVVLTTSHQPAALHKALGVFAELGCNLTKLQSRPIAGEIWQYQFYVDVSITPAQLRSVIPKLTSQGCEIVVLGIYTAALQTFDD